MIFCGLVLARGGSKSIPDKNIRLLCDQPLIHWVLKPMIDSEVFDEIWVSTDNPNIARIAQEFSHKVKIHSRKSENAFDTSSSLQAVKEFNEFRKDIDIICLVQCTSPCLHSSYLQKLHSMMTKEDYDSVFSVMKDHKLRWSLDGKALNFNPKSRPRRQDWSGEYIETGHFYCFTKELIEKHGLLQGEKMGFVEMPRAMCIEIDEMHDWDIAEIVVKKTK